MLRFCVAAAAALGLVACAAPEPTPAPAQAARATSDPESLANDGRAIAEAQCAGCHAVGQYGDSPNPSAPTFRTVLSRYRAEVLEEELIQGIQVSHPMPEFQFNPQGADALITYLRSIQEPAVEQ